MKVFVKEFKFTNKVGQKFMAYRYLVVKDNCGGEYLHVKGCKIKGAPFNTMLLIKIENLWSEFVL